MSEVCWFIGFVFALEAAWRRDGVSLIAEYARDLPTAGPRADHIRQLLGLLVGRLGAVTYQTGQRA